MQSETWVNQLNLQDQYSSNSCRLGSYGLVLGNKMHVWRLGGAHSCYKSPLILNLIEGLATVVLILFLLY